MNSIRALNVRTRIEEISGRHASPEMDTDTPSSCIAPFHPAAQPVPEQPSTASRSKAKSSP
jgi:hypothetical protein